MKKIRLSILLIVLGIGMNFAATANPSEEKSLSELKTQIQDLLKRYPHELPLEKDLLSKVEFVINDRNQIVILNMDTEDPALLSYVQARLNYKIVKHNLANPTQKIFVPIRFQK